MLSLEGYDVHLSPALRIPDELSELRDGRPMRRVSSTDRCSERYLGRAQPDFQIAANAASNDACTKSGRDPHPHGKEIIRPGAPTKCNQVLLQDLILVIVLLLHNLGGILSENSV